MFDLQNEIRAIDKKVDKLVAGKAAGGVRVVTTVAALLGATGLGAHAAAFDACGVDDLAELSAKAASSDSAEFDAILHDGDLGLDAAGRARLADALRLGEARTEHARRMRGVHGELKDAWTQKQVDVLIAQKDQQMADKAQQL